MSKCSSEISVQWSGLTNCRLVNGIITKYRVLYTAANSGDQEQSEDYTLRDDQNWMSGGEITLTGLSSSTNYSIAVAAVNENGDVGQSSAAVRTRTDQCNMFIPIINMLWLMFVLCCSLWFRVNIQFNWYSCWCSRPPTWCSSGHLWTYWWSFYCQKAQVQCKLCCTHLNV